MENNGLAGAVVMGFSLAGGDVLGVMDADLQHPPEILPIAYEHISDGADLVIPSRFIDDGMDEGLNIIRKAISSTAKYLGKLLFSKLRKVSDPTGGFFLMKKDVIKNVSLNPTGWKILMEVLVLGHYQNVVEIPYEFQKRNADFSKMQAHVMIDYILHLSSLFIRSRKTAQ
jgi:dolichol-phosphate mannosyltransferase